MKALEEYNEYCKKKDIPFRHFEYTLWLEKKVNKRYISYLDGDGVPCQSPHKHESVKAFKDWCKKYVKHWDDFTDFEEVAE